MGAYGAKAQNGVFSSAQRGSQVQELRSVSTKQIEHEQHIKRLNQIINSLCEEAKNKDNRIK